MKSTLVGFLAVCLTWLTNTPIVTAAPAEVTWKEFFPHGLVDSNGKEVSPNALKGKMVCLYFSASWCGPCKAVTPRLAALRDQANGSLEVVLVSQDRSEADQLKYMREAKMKWPAAKWSNYLTNDGNQVNKLVSKFQAWGIPAIVVLSPAGEVLDAEARMKVQLLPEEQIQHLQDFDYEAVLKTFRADRAKKGVFPTKEQDRYTCSESGHALKKRSKNSRDSTSEL